MKFDHCSIGYINECDLQNVHQIDIEVLDVGSGLVVGVCHENFEEVTEYPLDAMDVGELLSVGTEFVYTKASGEIKFADSWTSYSDCGACLQVVKDLVASQQQHTSRRQ